MALAHCRFIRRRSLAALKPLPIAPALLASTLAALVRSPIAPGRPPTGPAPRRRLAGRAAVARKRMAGLEMAPTAFQETPPAAWTAACADRNDARLMRGLIRKMLMWAHGSYALPSGQVSEGSDQLLLRDAFLSTGD